MTRRKILLPRYYQRNKHGELVEVIQQRFYEKIEWEEIEVNEEGISRGHLEALKKTRK